MLKANDCALIFIDVQGRLHEIMPDRQALNANLERLVRAARLLEVPIVGTEQIPEKLGPTNEPFRSLLQGVPMIGKSTFSCCGEPAFLDAFQSLEKGQAILCGIETHVCVYQTAIDLLEGGNEVFVASNAVASRCPRSKDRALQAMRDAGAVALPVETILFALLRDAADPRFKQLLQLVK